MSDEILLFREFTCNVRDPEYGDYDEYPVTLQAERSYNSFPKTEGEIFGILSDLIRQKPEDWLEHLRFCIAFDSGRYGKAVHWSLPKGVNPNRVATPMSSTEAIAKAKSLLKSVAESEPNAPMTKRINKILYPSLSF